MPSAAPVAMPANSAPLELTAMVFCVVDQCFDRAHPTRADPPRMWTAECGGTRQKSVSAKVRIQTPSSRHGTS
eukprot:11946934-Alexandrium_andersonii.AAC.1